MIKLKTYPITEADSANEFMKEHPPRSTEKQSGIVFHNGHIVIIHDDGSLNPSEEKGRIYGELEGDRGKMFLVKHSLTMAELALDKELEDLQKLVPEGYQMEMGDDELKKLLAVGTEATFVPKAQVEKFKESIKPNEDRIGNLKNEILMDNHELNRLEHSLRGWEKMLTK